MLGGIPTLAERSPHTAFGQCLPLDANLGVSGLPQSGTGQTSLFTGLNAAEIFGRHFGPWTPVKLRPVLAEQNLLKRAQAAGRSIAFANAYPEGYPRGVRTLRQAAPPLSALSAGALTRHHDALRNGNAVASGIENTGWISGLGFHDMPHVSATRAGENLGKISRTANLTVFAHYDTDHAGHEGSLQTCVLALERVDQFLGGLIDAMDRDTTLVVASDHGNIEDTTEGHTRNPVLGLVFRKAGWDRSTSLTSILDVTPFILDTLKL